MWDQHRALSSTQVVWDCPYLSPLSHCVRPEVLNLWVAEPCRIIIVFSGLNSNITEYTMNLCKSILNCNLTHCVGHHDRRVSLTLGVSGTSAPIPSPYSIWQSTATPTLLTLVPGISLLYSACNCVL